MYVLAIDNIKVVNDFVPPILPTYVNLLTPTKNQQNVLLIIINLVGKRLHPLKM